MNFNSMSDRELVHYCDLYSDDPVVRRLVNALNHTRGGLIAELEEAGMDPHTWQFETKYQHLYPGDYIQELRREIEILESDLEHAQQQLEDSEKEREELTARSIMDFVQEVWQEKRDSEDTVREAMKTIKAFKDENAKLKEQIDMWGRMNQVKVTAE